MKRILLCMCFFVGMIITGRSQTKNFKKFKVDLGIGYAIPVTSGSGAVGGVTFTIQPHYRISDDFAAGLRFEGAALGYKTGSSSDTKVSISILSSYCATGEYYLKKSGFRPFVGAGLGMFSFASIDFGKDNNGQAIVSPVVSKFGFFPTIGFETGHFRMSAEYNSLPEKTGYLAFKLGFFFGGGKK